MIRLKNVDPPHLIGLTCGTVPTVYATVDFGVRSEPAQAFAMQRKFAKNGPLVSQLKKCFALLHLTKIK